MSSDSSMQFEKLPDELWYDIIDYLKLQYVYQAFFGLNKRIDDILRSLERLSLSVRSIQDITDESIDFFAERIDRLHLCTDEVRAFDLTYFPNIRFLNIQLPSDAQVAQIRPENFPNLISLTIGFPLQISPPLAELHEHIFSNGFPLLTKCTVINRIETNISWTVSPTLRTVSMYSSYLSIFRAVLNSCPNLVRLNISGQMEMSAPISSISSNHPLKFLAIHMNGWSKTVILSSILIHVPNLEYLLVKSRNEATIDFVQVAQILTEHVPKLHRFICDVYLRKSNDIKIDIIRQLHPCFTGMKLFYLFGNQILIKTTTQ